MTRKTSNDSLERKALPFFVEFVKFATAFTIIMMFALVLLRAVSEAGG